MIKCVHWWVKSAEYWPPFILVLFSIFSRSSLILYKLMIYMINKKKKKKKKKKKGIRIYIWDWKWNFNYNNNYIKNEILIIMNWIENEISIKKHICVYTY